MISCMKEKKEFINKNLLFKSNEWLFRNTQNLNVAARLERQQETTLWHSHESNEIACIYRGEGNHETRDVAQKISTGDVVLIPPGVQHRYIVEPDSPLVLCNLLFDPESLPIQQLDMCQIPGFMDLFLPETDNVIIFKLPRQPLSEARYLLNRLGRETAAQLVGNKSSRLALFMLIMVLLSRNYATTSFHSTNSAQLQNVLKYLNSHYLENISIESLPRMCNMSRSKFLREFTKISGTSPLQYILRLRVNRACRELVESDRNITEIAFLCGFSDSNYFSRVFSKNMGVSPIHYRQAHS